MRGAAVVWFAFVAIISLVPLSVKDRLYSTGHFHDIGHFFAFLTASMLLCWGARTTAKLVYFAGVCCFAFLIEALEVQIYRSPFEWHDVAVDVMGATVGLALVFHRTRVKRTA